jgi:8-amino-7-oxononanoate synthase
MSTTASSSLNSLLQERTESRILRIFSEHVQRQRNSFCQIDEVDGKYITIAGQKLLNFNSVNYLGMEFHPHVIRATQEAVAKWGTHAGTARAAGEMRLYEELEGRIANYLGVDNVVLFTTVTLANHGIIPLLMRQNTLVLVDWEAHSSVQRAAIEAKGGGATLLNFSHDDFDQLENFLKEHRAKHRHAMIALDGVYGMLGTYLDLPHYQALANKYDAFLFIDDAHGFGTIGPEGQGIVSHYGGSYENTIYVGSLEKALSNLGGFVVLPREVRDFIRYTCHTYIFCGQLPAGCLAGGIAAMDVLENEGAQLRSTIHRHVAHVKKELDAMGYEIVGEEHPFPLLMVKVGDVYSVPKVSQFFYDEGLNLLVVGFPVIPLTRGAMVRISLTAAHTDAQVELLLDAFRRLKDVLAEATPKRSMSHDGNGKRLNAH